MTPLGKVATDFTSVVQIIEKARAPLGPRPEPVSTERLSEARELNNDEYLCGNNIFFETAALRASGGFDVGFCEPEARWIYGDETLPRLRLLMFAS